MDLVDTKAQQWLRQKERVQQEQAIVLQCQGIPEDAVLALFLFFIDPPPKLL